ncbi:hypothetical protein SAMN05880590_107159 [Rhizobium sp. RU35A]|uniref:nuclear transport factor 2 family protein n=1 Tax=Rhizobium sp. RU35A TaxID=1907414 RepID=UPI00095631B4|nr:DUF4440 domain-containing protein [Rhizobium sp. RU35A]SIQ78299.1 hypothetical protein SAMN05880590_107159 [Rhizobium sp. RU35A]
MNRQTAETIIALEQCLHQPAIRTAQDRVTHLLAEDFIEFGSSGRIFDRQTTVAALAAETPSAPDERLETLDYVVKELAGEVVLITYRARRTGSWTGSIRETLRSSIWAFRDGRWQMIFHQGTVVPSA